MKQKLTPADKLQRKTVRVDNKCWYWFGTKNGKGYGVTSIDGKKRMAHQVAWEVHHGLPFPEGMVTDHICRDHSCVNPYHLEPVTNVVNVLRGTGLTAMNARKERCVNFHDLDEENTYIRPRRDSSQNPVRQCKECARIRVRAFRARKALAAALAVAG